uniref:Uncharacterized protein n=1 Tax=Mycena chlorophos TaxID=658473 RepID=A0ABQ0LIE4_MYCCL|nr:predicted protein [Mycena chlorophos]
MACSSNNDQSRLSRAAHLRESLFSSDPKPTKARCGRPVCGTPPPTLPTRSQHKQPSTTSSRASSLPWRWSRSTPLLQKATHLKPTTIRSVCRASRCTASCATSAAHCFTGSARNFGLPISLEQPDDRGGIGDEDWTEWKEGDIQKASGKASSLLRNILAVPSLQYINHLSASVTPTRAKQLLKPVPVGGPEENTPAYYYAHLAWADHLFHALLYPTAPPKPSAKFSTPLSTPVKAPADKSFGRELSGLRAAMGPLFGAEHPNVALLARVIELRALVAPSRWSDVPPALERAENDLGILFLAPAHPPPLYTTSTFHAVVTLHVLVLSVVWYTYSAAAAPESETAASSPSNINGSPVGRRLTLLCTVIHAAIYNGKRREAEEVMLQAEGVLAVPLDPKHPPLFVRTTHPRVLYALKYLISAIARRDLVGRKPKRKTFILKGLVVDREAVRELKVPRWASAGDVQTIELQMAKIQADLKCELVSANIMWSEFAEAEKTLNHVIAHTRTFGLFEGTLAPRITLLHAQLAHARGQVNLAQTCCRVAAKLATGAGDIAGSVAAHVGEVVLLLGLWTRARVDPLARIPMADDNKELERMTHEVAASCRGLGGAMRAVVLTSEILTVKQHLKHALAFATDHPDSHLPIRPGRCWGRVGAPPKKEKDKHNFDSSGNVPLRLWAGERYLELHKRVGQTKTVQKRTEANTVLRQAAVSLDSPYHSRSPGPAKVVYLEPFPYLVALEEADRLALQALVEGWVPSRRLTEPGLVLTSRSRCSLPSLDPHVALEQLWSFCSIQRLAAAVTLGAVQQAAFEPVS